MFIKTRRVAFIAAATAAATVMVGSTAMGAPTKGPAFSATCPGLGAVDVVGAPGQGTFTPAFVVGTNQVLIPYAVSGTVTVDGEPVDEFNDVKPAPVPEGAISCTFEATFTEDGQMITVEGTALVVPRGAPA